VSALRGIGAKGKVAALATALTVAAALALGAGGCGDSGAQPEPPQPDPTPESAAQPRPDTPNVVFVMTDDQTVADLEQMPKTRRLVGERGASFDNFIVSFPLCCPSRASFLTGRYAHNSGVLSNSPEHGGGYAAMQQRHTIAAWLRAAGYRTASVGRYLNFYGVLDPTEVPPVWDEWYVPPGPSTYIVFDYELNENGELVSYGSEPGDYQTDVFARHARRFVRENAGADHPFFLSVTPLAPHGENDERAPSRFEGPRPAPRHRGELRDLELPGKPSLEDRDRSDRPSALEASDELSERFRERMEGSNRRRGRSLLAVDDLVAGLVRELRRADALDDTYIFFTSDNGFLLGEHGLKGKITPYDEVVRVPLLVRGPGIEAGGRHEGMAANIDIAPTVAELAGAEPTRRVDGISLVPALEGGRALPERDILLENLDESGVPKQPLYAGIRNRRFSYVEYEPRGVELYDMRDDPHQLRNLAGDPDHRADERRLARRLAELRDCRGGDCR
jgi:N-acetylglucosamine-6-sulfatase